MGSFLDKNYQSPDHFQVKKALRIRELENCKPAKIKSVEIKKLSTISMTNSITLPDQKF